MYSNQLTEKAYGLNVGSISIDTINLSIRLHYTGTTGSGGFAPYIQQTFYFQDLSSLYWSEDKNKKQLLLQIKSTYNVCNRQHKPIYIFEKSFGCRDSEDRVGNGADYTSSCFAFIKLAFNKEKFTDDQKNNLINWLNELKFR